MDQPVFWGALTATALIGIAVRLAVRRPLWLRRSSGVPPRELAVAAMMVAVLVFHCSAMFFAELVDAVPFTGVPAGAVRDLGLFSQATYWVPVAVLVLALRTVWRPALVLLTATLVGVGYTMFVPHALTTHLTWLAAATITLVVIAAALVAPLRREAPMSA